MKAITEEKLVLWKYFLLKMFHVYCINAQVKKPTQNRFLISTRRKVFNFPKVNRSNTYVLTE